MRLAASSYCLTIALAAIAALGTLGFQPRVSVHAAAMRAELTPAGARAYEALALTDTFERANVGGVVSTQACALQTLLNEAQGRTAFRALLDEPSLVAKLYGVTGLWHRDPENFLGSIVALDTAHGQDVVRTASGCVREQRPVHDLLFAYHGIHVPPATPVDHALGMLPSEFTEDISGGTVPLALAHHSGCKPTSD